MFIYRDPPTNRQWDHAVIYSLQHGRVWWPFYRVEKTLLKLNSDSNSGQRVRGWQLTGQKRVVSSFIRSSWPIVILKFMKSVCRPQVFDLQNVMRVEQSAQEQIPRFLERYWEPVVLYRYGLLCVTIARQYVSNYMFLLFNYIQQ